MFKRRLPLLIVLMLFLLQPALSNSGLPSEPAKKKRPKIGLVFSGGGAKGFAYIGMLRVFQEVGLPIDYIGGTSIGSIMGGLYAIGYSPDAIQEMIEKQDWDALIKDEIPRKYIAYEEKEFLENSIISLPFKKRKVGLKSSMYKGQQINLLLNRYFSPAWNISDFNKLPTPFLCVATNLINGDAEVLRTGYLPMAIRSSMSIPGYFSATHFNGKYLVDGGIINNYPAGPVKKMGAEYLIGGDVQSGLADTISNLKSMTEILNQIIFFRSEKANIEADSLININIKFHVPAGMMDFTSYERIIDYGDSLARAYEPQLRALADSLNKIEKVEIKKHDAKPLDYVEIADIKYSGNFQMSQIFLNNYFGEFKNSRVTFDELDHTITSIYGTKFFKYIFYSLEPRSDGRADLIINMEESSPGYFSASVHYDNNYYGSVRINGVFRNIFGNRSKLFGELVLGSNPRFRALYLISNGAKPGFGVEVDMYSFKFNDYNKDQKINEFTFNNLKTSVFITSTIKNLYSIRIGGEYEYFQFQQNLETGDSLQGMFDYNAYGNLFFNFSADTRDKLYFSTKGFKANFKVAYIVPISKGWVEEIFTNSLVAFVNYNHSIKLSPRFVFRPGFFIGGTFHDELPPPQHWYGVGGLNEVNYIKNYVPFTGVYFIQKFGVYSAIGRLKLQYNVFKKVYLTALTDVGATEYFVDDMFDMKRYMMGYGITASYNSIIGPVEFTAMGSNMNPSVSFFINIGFSF